MYFIKIKFISNTLSYSFSSWIFLRMFKIIKRISKIRKEERNKIKKKNKEIVKQFKTYKTWIPDLRNIRTGKYNFTVERETTIFIL